MNQWNAINTNIYSNIDAVATAEGQITKLMIIFRAVNVTGMYQISEYRNI